MTRYAAHIIMAILKDPYDTGKVTVRENVCILDASDYNQAYERAIRFAKLCYEIADDGLRVDDAPAVNKLLGVRKIVEVSYYDECHKLIEFEATYSEFLLDSLKDAQLMARGDSIDLIYLD